MIIMKTMEAIELYERAKKARDIYNTKPHYKGLGNRPVVSREVDELLDMDRLKQINQKRNAL